eukprot:787522-Rhodomonas_salina.2
MLSQVCVKDGDRRWRIVVIMPASPSASTSPPPHHMHPHDHQHHPDHHDSKPIPDRVPMIILALSANHHQMMGRRGNREDGGFANSLDHFGSDFLLHQKELLLGRYLLAVQVHKHLTIHSFMLGRDS